MPGFVQLLRNNRNYRFTWAGQVVSEIGDHFNTIAVFGLVYQTTHSGFAVSGVMLARAIPMLLAGPLAGVALDRFDRKRVMITSDLVRAAFAFLFILFADGKHVGLLYALSAMLMFASPFFTSGRASILPVIARKEELHAANSLMQTTQWANTAIGSFLGGISASRLGYEWAFFFNALSFLFSAWCISQLRVPEGFKAKRSMLSEDQVMRPWREYADGLAYMRGIPLVFAIAMVHVGWATGGGAAQILFTLFSEQVYQRGPEGIGFLWAAAGVGLVCGGGIGHWIGPKLSFKGYKLTIASAYIIHGIAYILFSLMPTFGLAMIFIAISRASVAVSSVLNFGKLLRLVEDQYRGRVFSTLETLTWSMMMLSMFGAGWASDSVSPRTIGVVSGILSSSTSVFWIWANATGRLPEPSSEPGDDDIEVHGDPNV